MKETNVSRSNYLNRILEIGRSYMWTGLAALMVIASLACGGGGGGTTTGTVTGTTTGNDVTNARIWAVQSSNVRSAVDTANVLVGDRLQLQVTARDSSGNLVVLNGTSWATTAPSTVATVTSSGVLNAFQSSGGVAYTITCTGPNGALNSTFIVQPVQAIVTGLVRNVNNTPVPETEILLYTASGVAVGQAVTGLDGTFRASVPPTTSRFTIDKSNADPLLNGVNYYYNSFGFGTKDYLDANSGCLAPVPAVSVGNLTPLPDDIVLDDKASGPPPPPDGCVP